ncbi:MAG: SPASM domain-containing protein [Candidatus Aenigmarchaeota archaeon]|nr:SPASM domain-containing protein [Candidatus Aenigmarchaeota archaeon]
MYQKLRGMQAVRKIARNPNVARNPLVGYAYRRRMESKIKGMHSFPPGLLVETINTCNAKCTMCPYPAMTRKKEFMPMELYKKIVDEAAGQGVKRFQLNATNEPLTDPLIFKRIQYAREKGITGTRFFSNGSLLSEEKAKALLESGLELLIISLDGATKEVYEKVRVGLDYDTVIANITRFLEMRKAGGYQYPKVELHMTVSKANTSEAEAFVSKFKQLADVVTTTIAHDWAGQTQENNPLHVITNPVPATPCRKLWFDFNVLADGRVALCCLDYDGKVILGDVKSQSIMEIWNGEAYRKIRDAHVNGNQSTLNLCNTCHQRDSWWRGDEQ